MLQDYLILPFTDRWLKEPRNNHGRDFIAGGDRQKTEMVDGIACGDYGIICY